MKIANINDMAMTKQEMANFLLENNAWLIGEYIIAVYESVTGHTCYGVFSCVYMDGLYYLSSKVQFGIRIGEGEKGIRRCIEYALEH